MYYLCGIYSGGESKDDFWKMVHISTDILPKDKPRYLMGVGFAEDLVVCSALGCDMYDCVFPTRTAVSAEFSSFIENYIGYLDHRIDYKCFLHSQRFGSALTFTGQISLKHKKYKTDFTPVDADCNCSTCKTYTKAYLHSIVTHETVACHILTVHNIAFQVSNLWGFKFDESIETNLIFTCFR